MFILKERVLCAKKTGQHKQWYCRPALCLHVILVSRSFSSRHKPLLTAVLQSTTGKAAHVITQLYLILFIQKIAFAPSSLTALSALITSHYVLLHKRADQFEKKFEAECGGWGASHSIKEVSAGVAARALKKSIHKFKCGTAAQIFSCN